MIDTVLKQTCDVCGGYICITNDDNVPSWTIPSEVGDLCPSCANAWKEYKERFIKEMKENSEVER